LSVEALEAVLRSLGLGHIISSSSKICLETNNPVEEGELNVCCCFTFTFEDFRRPCHILLEMGVMALSNEYRHESVPVAITDVNNSCNTF
jgi:hypothetical protein